MIELGKKWSRKLQKCPFFGVCDSIFWDLAEGIGSKELDVTIFIGNNQRFFIHHF